MTNDTGNEFSVRQQWGGPWRLGDGICGHCNHAVAFKATERKAFSWSIDVVIPAEETEGEEWIEQHRFMVGVCPRPTCSRATIVHDVWLDFAGSRREPVLEKREIIYPLASDRAPLPSEVPASLRALYEEAGRIEYLSPNGAAFLGRRMLEQTLEDSVGESDRLVDLIDRFLAAQPLPEKLDTLMHDVRQFGNIAAHPAQTGDGEWIDVDQEEATYVLDVVSELLDHVYVRPKRRAAMRERWQAKRKGTLPGPAAGHRVQVEPAEKSADEPDSPLHGRDDLPF